MYEVQEVVPTADTDRRQGSFIPVKILDKSEKEAREKVERSVPRRRSPSPSIRPQTDRPDLYSQD
jgi:hypothetical protein